MEVELGPKGNREFQGTKGETECIASRKEDAEEITALGLENLTGLGDSLTI